MIFFIQLILHLFIRYTAAVSGICKIKVIAVEYYFFIKDGDRDKGISKLYLTTMKEEET